MDLGKAFEYACAIAIGKTVTDLSFGMISVSYKENQPFKNARSCYNKVDEITKENLLKGAVAASKVIAKTEPKLINNEPGYEASMEIAIQADAIGRNGDVRDVIAVKRKIAEGGFWEIGISCKHNHDAVKHPRVSPTIDFGAGWLGQPLEAGDFAELERIFAQIEAERRAGVRNWSDVSNKEEKFYLPVLNIILRKILSHPDQEGLVRNLISYVIGNKDFYKIIYRKPGRSGSDVTVQGFNFNGTLNQGAEGRINPGIKVNRLHYPTRVSGANIISGSSTTLEILCDNGWQVSMRAHSASSKLEKSIKMDVRLEGIPPSLFVRSA